MGRTHAMFETHKTTHLGATHTGYVRCIREEGPKGPIPCPRGGDLVIFWHPKGSKDVDDCRPPTSEEWSQVRNRVIDWLDNTCEYDPGPVHLIGGVYDLFGNPAQLETAGDDGFCQARTLDGRVWKCMSVELKRITAEQFADPDYWDPSKVEVGAMQEVYQEAKERPLECTCPRDPVSKEIIAPNLNCVVHREHYLSQIR